jgi:hypothetical protein
MIKSLFVKEKEKISFRSYLLIEDGGSKRVDESNQK